MGADTKTGVSMGTWGKRGQILENQHVLLTHRQDASLIYASLSTASESMGHPEGLVWLFLTLEELDPVILELGAKKGALCSKSIAGIAQTAERGEEPKVM